jgi:hypothetical protein
MTRAFRPLSSAVSSGPSQLVGLICLAFALLLVPLLARAQAQPDAGTSAALVQSSSVATIPGAVTPAAPTQINVDLAALLNPDGTLSQDQLKALASDAAGAAKLPSKTLLLMFIGIALVYAVRKWAAPACKAIGWVKIGAFLVSDRGGAITTLVLAALLVIASVLMAGGAVTLTVMGTGLIAGFNTIGGYVGVRKILGLSSSAATLSP